MKKIIFALAVTFSVTAVSAQNLSLGPTVGFGHSWLSLSEDFEGAESSFHPSYNAGVKLVYSFVHHWGISADLRFSSEGGTFKSTGDEDAKLKFRSNYLRIPVQGIYFFGDLGDGVRPKVALGPTFGFLLGGEAKSVVDGEEIGSSDIKDAFKTFDFGLVGSVGANFRLMGDKWLNTDITYSHGFSDISQEGDVRIRNRGIGLNVGLTFPIGTVKNKSGK